MMYQLLLLLHRDTDNLSIGQCWHTLHNSHLHHKDNRHYWLHHYNGHFQPALHNHNLKIGAKYILIMSFRLWNFKMVDPKKQDFWPKINILKGYFVFHEYNCQDNTFKINRFSFCLRI